MRPSVEVEGARVFLGDCRDVLKTLPDNSVDSIVTDPPYGLNFMGKEWDNPAMLGQGNSSRNWVLKKGDPGYVAGNAAWYGHNDPLKFQLWCTEWAVECLRVLKPGGHILAFGGTRTWHRLAVAVEDAGFEIRDNIAWIYGSGFPKSLDVSKAIDKKRDERHTEALAVTIPMASAMRENGLTRRDLNVAVGREPNDGGSAQSWTTVESTGAHKPRVPTLEQWVVLRDLLGLSQLDAEVWRLNGRKGKPGENWDKREVIGQQRQGRLAVAPGQGEDRSGVDLDITLAKTPEAQQWQGWGTALKPAFEPVVVGRKPLVGTVAENVLLWGVGGLNIDGSRIGSIGDHKKPFQPTNKSREVFGAQKGFQPSNAEGRWPANVVLDEFTAGLLDEQSGVRKVGGPGQSKSGAGGVFGGGDNSELNHYGDTGGASRFFYQAKASKRDRNEGLEDLDLGEIFPQNNSLERKEMNATAGSRVQNFHPTVKPTQLMRYLIKLVTPEGGTVLDPFTGSGSTGKAALLDGYGFIGAELTEEYLPIIEGRLRWAVENRDEETLF